MRAMDRTPDRTGERTMTSSPTSPLRPQKRPSCAPLASSRSTEPFRPSLAYRRAIRGRILGTCSFRLPFGHVGERGPLGAGFAAELTGTSSSRHSAKLDSVFGKLALHGFGRDSEFGGDFFRGWTGHMRHRMRASTHCQQEMFSPLTPQVAG